MKELRIPKPKHASAQEIAWAKAVVEHLGWRKAKAVAKYPRAKESVQVTRRAGTKTYANLGLPSFDSAPGYTYTYLAPPRTGKARDLVSAVTALTDIRERHCLRHFSTRVRQ